MNILKVFIGYDPRQPIAFQVCAHSVWEHASKPVEIIRLDLRTLPITRRGLTEFTYSRFLVPYLSNFEGYSLFLDSDVLVRADIYELILDVGDMDAEALYFVRHERKFERPSVMLFNNRLFKNLTPERVQTGDMFNLDSWAYPDLQVGLPKEWNHLVGYDPPNPAAKIVHYTMGIPVWLETRNCEFAEEWHATHRRMNSTVSFQELMGRSVHIPHIAALK